jgi:hypothetical protein
MPGFLSPTRPSAVTRWFGCAAVALVASLAAVVTSTPAVARASAPQLVRAAAHGVSKPDKLRDPSANLSAAPDYLDFCAVNGPRNATCVKRALKAINNAHAAEGIRKMILPSDYAQLTTAEQTFVITDLERVARGLRPFVGLTARLNQNAHHAAVVRDDPTLLGAILSLLGVREYGSIWAGDFGPLASDFDWMYNDGYSSDGSVNLDCTRPGQSGCWGHRHVILGLYSGLPHLLAGGGTAKPAGASIAEVLCGTVGHVPALTYSWKDALAFGANGHKVTAA